MISWLLAAHICASRNCSRKVLLRSLIQIRFNPLHYTLQRDVVPAAKGRKRRPPFSAAQTKLAYDFDKAITLDQMVKSIQKKFSYPRKKHLCSNQRVPKRKFCHNLFRHLILYFDNYFLFYKEIFSNFFKCRLRRAICSYYEVT